MYSPDEVELYLIDFKKGVEFKTYAQHALPHARVVAIESEREFGLSVLERLDAELRRRGDLFRDDERAGSGRLSRRERPGAAAANLADRRRVPGALRRGRQAGPGGVLVAGPAGAARAGLRHSRAAGLADAGRGLQPGAQHARADGGADCPAVQRVGRPPDPQRRQLRRAAFVAARRGDLQRLERPGRRQSSLPGRLAFR